VRSTGRIPRIATERLGFIGAGRVGRGLSLALTRAGYTVSGVASRARGDAQRIVEASDIVFLTVPDDAIAAVCQKISWRKGQSAVHCAGATELTVLQPAAAAGAAIGGFHPLVMFADPQIAARSIAGAAIGIEAEEPISARLRTIAQALGARVLVIPPGGRAAYHGAAHFAAGFVGALLAEGVEIWGRIGIPPQDATPALFALLRGAIEAMGHSGIGRAMAGSIARGDVQNIERHLAALGELEPRARELYCTLALRSIPLVLQAGRITRERAEELRAVLSARPDR
jgi:predicted short-subunit dehydrogenase-like oxidoreductase (DUF2520 family)